jgi:FemAB-related protein (PEP-CTERM system-associated)
MRIVELADEEMARRWDECVQCAPEATVYHLAGWKRVMERTFGHEAHYLLAVEQDQVRGVLPLLHIKSRLAGHYLTSPSGGMCCLDEQAAGALLAWAKELVRTVRASYLILRDSYRQWDDPDLVTNKDHCTLVARLSPDWEEVVKGIKRKERQLTHQGLRAGASVVDGVGQLGRFYLAYARAMRDKGTPTPGIRFFQNTLDQFPAHMRLLVVHREDQVLGGGIIAPFRDTVHCAWAGVLHEFRDLRPSHLLYWETMAFGSANGCRWVDFGRSLWGSGSFAFKRSWGGEPRQIYQQYYLNDISHPPAVGGGREDEAAYRLFVRIWRRLPLPVAEVLGPQLRKRMPFG